MDPNIAYNRMEQMAALRGMQFPIVSATSFDPTKMKTVENMQFLEQQSQPQQTGESSQRSILEMSAMPLVSYEQYQQLSSGLGSAGKLPPINCYVICWCRQHTSN